jgi:hypothetical protein
MASQSVTQEAAMQPEAVATGLVATHDGGTLGEMKPILGRLDPRDEFRRERRRHVRDPGFLPKPDTEGERPRVLTKL